MRVVVRHPLVAGKSSSLKTTGSPDARLVCFNALGDLEGFSQESECLECLLSWLVSCVLMFFFLLHNSKLSMSISILITKYNWHTWTEIMGRIVENSFEWINVMNWCRSPVFRCTVYDAASRSLLGGCLCACLGTLSRF